MKKLKLGDIARYIEENIGKDFHDKKFAKLRALTLDDVLRRKNPYLFKAKNANDAAVFVEAVLDATVSSGEETVFGNFLEGVAIHVCGLVFGGRKSGIKGIDLEFEVRTTKYLTSIKSGPNWGNSGQIQNLKRNFNEAKKTLATSGGARGFNVICVEACCYGADDNPEKGSHIKLCGQRFWELVSGGNSSLYIDIIEPLGHMAKERNAELEQLYSSKKNIFVAEFINLFCEKGVINWPKLVKYNSGKGT